MANHIIDEEEIVEIELLSGEIARGLYVQKNLDSLKYKLMSSGLHVYDIRGCDDDPGAYCTIELRTVTVNRVASFVTPDIIHFEPKDYTIDIRDRVNFIGIQGYIDDYYRIRECD